MRNLRRSGWVDAEHVARQTLERYLRFMALKASVGELRKALHDLRLTPGINWGGYQSWGQWTSGSSKSDMAQSYAMKKNFEDGALRILEDKFGTRWDHIGPSDTRGLDDA